MRLSPKGLIGWSILLVAAIVAIQLLASVAFYFAIDRQTLREDHARRIAELLVVGARVHDVHGDAQAAAIMSSSYLQLTLQDKPPVPPADVDHDADAITRYVRQWEPELARRQLVMWSEEGGPKHDQLVGAMRLEDGKWMVFRSSEFSRGWPIALRATLTTVVAGLLCLGLSVYALRRLGGPLRRLTEAAKAFGHGRPTPPVEVSGPPDLQELTRAFNEMQGRITALIEDQARSMDAVSHDLRTPLSRLQLAAEFMEPGDTRDLVVANVEELAQLLNSLSAYLRAQHKPSEPEVVDLAQVARTIAQKFPGKAHYVGPASLEVTTHREALEQSLLRLADNGVRYGGAATLELRRGEAGPEIHVRDQGPGMTPEHLERIYEPFFRADEARGRDTPGFGLGVPTAQRLLRRFGGDMAVTNAEAGGLDVTVWPPSSV